MTLLLFTSAGAATQKNVTDTANLQAVEGPLSAQTIHVFETAYLSLGEVTASGLGFTSALFRADDATLTLADFSSIVKTTPVLFSKTDTASLHLGEVSAMRVAFPRTDTASITLTETSTKSVVLQTFATTDTASLTLTEASGLTTFTGLFPLSTTDVCSLAVTENALFQPFDFHVVRNITFAALPDHITFSSP